MFSRGSDLFSSALILLSNLWLTFLHFSMDKEETDAPAKTNKETKKTPTHFEEKEKGHEDTNTV